MQVGVIGAGAIGGTLAALLARAGHGVQVTARGAQLEAIERGGIRLSGAWGDHVADVEASEILRRGPELVIVATKAQDAAAALRANAAFLRNIPVVVVQNGLDGVVTARAVAPAADVIGGLALFASSYLSPGEVTVTAPGSLFLGGGPEGNDVPTLFAARLLRDLLPTSVVGNFVGAQWTKLVINQVNALPAITGLSAQEVVNDPRLRRILTLGMVETVRTAVSSGIRFEKLQGLSNAGLRLFAALPVGIGQVFPRILGSRMGSTPNPGSTLQSIRRGQATEIDYLNGAVVRAGETAGVRTPVNAALVGLVHDVEHTGRFLSPAEVAVRVLNRR
jgi:2-dehydropantoate 2-reductase